jgi:hypothetical protein
MKETFGQKTRRSHKRNQRVVMFWCAFVFAFVIAGVWLFRGTLFQNDSGASSSGTNQSRHDACGTADSRQKSTDVTQAPMDHEVCQKLQDLVSQDQRVQQVIDNCEIYPEDILKMLSRNLDMLNFVLEYPEKVGQVFAETVGEVEGGEVPLLLQYDQVAAHFGSGIGEKVAGQADSRNQSGVVHQPFPYGTVAGRVHDSRSRDDTITPYVVAQYASEQGYYVPGAGTAWTLMSEGAKHFGVIGEELPLTKSIMEGVLKEGRPIICSMRPGDFTTTGHFIVITGIKDGQFTVNDPNSTERSNMLWDYDTLKPQISNLWAFQAL